MPDELVVHPEVVLQRDRREGLVLLLDAHALLGLDGLVQALRPAAALEDAAGELVDDPHLVVDHGVVDVALVQRLGLQRLEQVVDHVAVLGPVQVVDRRGSARPWRRRARSPRRSCASRRTRSRSRRRSPSWHAGRGRRGACPAPSCGRAWRTGGSSSAACSGAPEMISGVRASSMRMLSTSSTIAERVAALDLLLDRGRHVVAQVVEAELGVRAVRDVGGVGDVLVLVGLHVLQHADASRPSAS